MARPSADRDPPIVVGTNSGVSASSGSSSFGSTAGDLVQNRFAGSCERRIAELANNPRPEHERLNLFAIEHERWQVVSGTESVADARFAVDRRARQDQIADVAVDRPLRNLQLGGDVRRGRGGAAPSQQLDDLEQTVGATHRTYCATAVLASTRPSTWPSGSSKTPSVTSGITVRGVMTLPAERHGLFERRRHVGRLGVEGHPRPGAGERLTDPSGDAARVAGLRHAVVDRLDHVERPSEQIAVEPLKLAPVVAEHLEPHDRMCHCRLLSLNTNDATVAAAS